MKRLLKSTNPPTEIATSGEHKNKYEFSPTDLVDILQQLEELKNFNIATKTEDGMLQLAVGDSVYEVSEIRSNRYPRRRLRKLET